MCVISFQEYWALRSNQFDFFTTWRANLELAGNLTARPAGHGREPAYPSAREWARQAGSRLTGWQTAVQADEQAGSALFSDPGS